MAIEWLENRVMMILKVKKNSLLNTYNVSVYASVCFDPLQC